MPISFVRLPIFREPRASRARILSPLLPYFLGSFFGIQERKGSKITRRNSAVTTSVTRFVTLWRGGAGGIVCFRQTLICLEFCPVTALPFSGHVTLSVTLAVTYVTRDVT